MWYEVKSKYVVFRLTCPWSTTEIQSSGRYSPNIISGQFLMLLLLMMLQWTLQTELKQDYRISRTICRKRRLQYYFLVFWNFVAKVNTSIWTCSWFCLESCPTLIFVTRYIASALYFTPSNLVILLPIFVLHLSSSMIILYVPKVFKEGCWPLTILYWKHVLQYRQYKLWMSQCWRPNLLSSMSLMIKLLLLSRNLMTHI